MRTILGALLILTTAATSVAGCASDPLGPLPEPVPLRCGDDPLTEDELVAEGQINVRSTGPCGDIVYQTFASGVSAQTLVSPGLDPVTLVGQPRGFSPSGDRLAVNGATGQVYDTATGETHDLFEGFGSIHFLRDRAEPPRTFTVGCGEMEVRILDADGSVRTLAEQVVSCPAVAPHAPIMLYQDSDGRLHRLDVETGDDLLLSEILYSDGTTTFPGSGRNDVLVLSSDGAVVVHHQRTWGSGRAWATLTRTIDGEVLGAIPFADGRLDVVSIPGGHVMAVTSGPYLWVLSQDYEFLAYDGLSTRGLLDDRQLLVWDDDGRELFVFEPVTGFRGEAIYLGDPETRVRPRVLHSANGRYVAVNVRTPVAVIAMVHDVVEERTTVLYEGDGDLDTRHVTDAGIVLVEGVLPVSGAIVNTRIIRVYGSEGDVLTEIAGRHLGRLESAGDSIYVQSYDESYSESRLDRVDATTGALTNVMDDLNDFRLAGPRLYYQSQPDDMGVTQLFARPR